MPASPLPRGWPSRVRSAVIHGLVAPWYCDPGSGPGSTCLPTYCESSRTLWFVLAVYLRPKVQWYDDVRTGDPDPRPAPRRKRAFVGAVAPGSISA
jgi:hypothetical protein